MLEALHCGRTVYPSSDYKEIKNSITDQVISKQYEVNVQTVSRFVVLLKKYAKSYLTVLLVEPYQSYK